MRRGRASAPLHQSSTQLKPRGQGLVPAAKALIEDATSFLKANPSNPKLLDFAGQINGLNSALADGDPAKIKNLMQNLAADLRQEPAYATLEDKRLKQQQADAEHYLPELVKIAKQEEAFIRYYVTNNPTARQTNTFIPLIKEIVAGLAAPDLGKLRDLTSKVEVIIREAGLADDFAKSKNLLTDLSQPRPNDASSQPGMLQKTVKNTFLLDGDIRDFILIYNSSPKAPHITKNLRGQFDFEGGEVKACLYQPGFDKSQISLLRQKLLEYKLQKIEVDSSECPRNSLVDYDVVAVERGQFAKLKDEISIVLYGELEADRFKHLLTITAAQRDQLSAAQLNTRARIRADIESGSKEGYGIVFVGVQAPTVCIVVSDQVKGHKQLLLDNIERLTSELNFTSLISKSSLDDAYKALQRNECEAVYSSAKELTNLVTALKKDETGYSVSSVWNSDAEIDKADKSVQEKELADATQATKNRNKEKADLDLKNSLRDAANTNKKKQQADLQTQFGKIAAASAASIADDIRKITEGNADWQASNAYAQFPTFVSLYRDLVQNRWELQSLNSEVADYGRAQWKDRYMETSFAKVSMRLRNRILGEYKDVCFVFGRMKDAEFAMWRDTVNIPCERDAQLEPWKKVRGFQSQWLVQ